MTNAGFASQKLCRSWSSPSRQVNELTAWCSSEPRRVARAIIGCAIEFRVDGYTYLLWGVCMSLQDMLRLLGGVGVAGGIATHTLVSAVCVNGW